MKEPHLVQDDPYYIQEICQLFLDSLMEVERKNASVREAAEAERLTDQKRQLAFQRELERTAYEGAIQLAKELERKVDERKVNVN